MGAGKQLQPRKTKIIPFCAALARGSCNRERRRNAESGLWTARIARRLHRTVAEQEETAPCRNAARNSIMQRNIIDFQPYRELAVSHPPWRMSQP
jgi:hypothetical protein